MGIRMKKLGILLIFSLIPFVGLNSVQTALADHGGFIDTCDFGQIWDPNSVQCIPDDQCPNGIYGLLLATVGIPHCFLVPMMAVGGEFLGVDSTALLVSGAQMNASWMIPVIISAIGIGIVIARKF